jgi:putative methionine-R-sulfoxide reductase with GAF domain
MGNWRDLVKRDYRAIEALVKFQGDRAARMRALVDGLWNGLSGAGVSWAGFYLHEGGDELICGPRRDKPACSPIGMHGACGRAFRERRPLIVSDVANLGASYVACDPRDKSELVIPLFETDGTCWGVLDFDSHETGAFDRADLEAVWRLLRLGGLTAENAAMGEVINT